MGKGQGLGIQFVDHARKPGANQISRVRVKGIVRNLRYIRYLLDQYNIIAHKSPFVLCLSR